MIKTFGVWLLLMGWAYADTWLIGGQSGSEGSASLDPDAPLILNYDAVASNHAVNLRTVEALMRTDQEARTLVATGGVLWVDRAYGHHFWHTATAAVTVAVAGRTDTNQYELLVLHLLAQDVTVSLVTNHLDAASLSRLDVSSNELFSLLLVGPVGQPDWFITDHHRSLAVPSLFSAVLPGLTNGLVFYTGFEGSAHDRTGLQAIRLTNTTDGAGLSFAAGVVGQAAWFSATNRTYLAYTNHPVAALAPLWANGNGFTLAYWEYKEPLAGDFIDVVLMGPLDGDGPGHDDLFGGVNQDLAVMHYVDDEYLLSRGGTAWWLEEPAVAEVWVHWVFTFTEDGFATVYRNGVYQEATELTLGSEATGHFVLGNTYEYAHWSYNGWLDEVGMWNRVLSELEIQALYNHGAGRALFP